jgi:hypothetical protein
MMPKSASRLSLYLWIDCLSIINHDIQPNNGLAQSYTVAFDAKLVAELAEHVKELELSFVHHDV